jgi:hypothetical protein
MWTIGLSLSIHARISDVSRSIDSRRELFQQADALQEYEALSLQRLTAQMTQTVPCHIDSDGDLRTDFEMSIFDLAMQHVLLPKVGNMAKQVGSVALSVPSGSKGLRKPASNLDKPSGYALSLEHSTSADQDRAGWATHLGIDAA